MGFNMMNRNMNYNFHVKLSTSEIELKNKLELQEKMRRKAAKANLSETDGSKIRWDGLLFWKKKRPKKSAERPSWKQAVKENCSSDLLDDAMEENGAWENRKSEHGRTGTENGAWENRKSEHGRTGTENGGMKGSQEADGRMQGTQAAGSRKQGLRTADSGIQTAGDKMQEVQITGAGAQGARTSGSGIPGAQEAGPGYSQEKLREAVFWAEILGEPVSKKRRKERADRLRRNGARRV